MRSDPARTNHLLRLDFTSYDENQEYYQDLICDAVMLIQSTNVTILMTNEVHKIAKDSLLFY